MPTNNYFKVASPRHKDQPEAPSVHETFLFDSADRDDLLRALDQARAAKRAFEADHPQLSATLSVFRRVVGVPANIETIGEIREPAFLQAAS